MADLKIATRKPDSMQVAPVYERKGLFARFARRLYQYKRLRSRFIFDLGYGVFAGFIHPYVKLEYHTDEPIGTVIAKNDDGTVTVLIGGQGKADG